MSPASSPGDTGPDKAPETGPDTAPEWDHERLARLGAHHPTPFHVLDCARLDRAADRLTAVLGSLDRRTRVHYSVKTNYLPFILRRLAGRGMGADVVSGYELEAALDAGFAPADIVFNGPVKTDGELAAAVRHGVRVHVDGEQEIAALERLAAEAGRRIEVGIRLSPGVPVSTSSDPSYRAQAATAALRNRFGWPAGSGELNRVVGLIARSPHLSLTAVHTHLSSQIVHEELMLQALGRIVDEAAALHRRFGLREVNIGGGFGVPGIRRPRTGPLTSLWAQQGGVPPQDPEPFLDIARLLPAADELMRRAGLDGVALACEPGRWLVSDAMAMVTRVVSRKELPAARWLLLDGGHNVAPWAGTGEIHRMTPIGRTYAARHSTWSVSGPLCYENDIHATAAELPDDIGPGDLLCLHDTGAYSLGRSNNFIRTRAAVVALDGDTETVVWRAETTADVFAFADPEPQPADAEAVRPADRESGAADLSAASPADPEAGSAEPGGVRLTAPQLRPAGPQAARPVGPEAGAAGPAARSSVGRGARPVGPEPWSAGPETVALAGPEAEAAGPQVRCADSMDGAARLSVQSVGPELRPAGLEIRSAGAGAVRPAGREAGVAGPAGQSSARRVARSAGPETEPSAGPADGAARR
ncbi:hypothetical protein [Streptomyces sp. PR69]|uniref:hypothetical protein n=1 Tax=Streptomyces sp. PR69 TaxID=2984950 RepID=UPI00226541F5|nr:hypothetical protein [Streptomyces sp. PR69]